MRRVNTLARKHSENPKEFLEKVGNYIPRKLLHKLHDLEEQMFFEYKNETSLNHKLELIKSNLNGNIEYFPTYRRVEENRDMFEINEMNDINFGGEDIEKIISDSLEELKKEINIQINELQLNIINNYIINENKLTKKGENQLINYLDKDNRLLKKILRYESANEVKDKKFLLHCFKEAELSSNKIEKMEESIANFIKICNQYLYNKKIKYNENSIELVLENETGILEFSSMSSGEKQIVGLFAKIILRKKGNLVIIMDEPELSLSLRWQSMLLLDIMRTQKCSLLLATTHSPFIFTNENIKPYASDLENYSFDNKVKK